MRAHTKVIRGGVIAALQEGPATLKQIEARMGISTTSLDRHLLQLSHEGVIRVSGFADAVRGRRPFIYALVEHKAEAAA